MSAETASPSGMNLHRAARLASVPAYPTFFAIYFVIRLYADNMALFHAADVIRPALVLGGLAVAAMLAARYALRTNIHNAAAGAFGLVFVLTVAGDFARFLGPSFVGTAGFALVVLLVAAIALAGHKTHRTTLIFNVFAVFLLAMPLYNIARAHLGETPVSAGRYLRDGVAASLPATPPSIVHITLDGYSRADVLTEVYGYDNGPFLNSLGTLGFSVIDGATSPYNQTLPNMAAIFAGEYLDFGRLEHETLNADDMRRMLGRHIGDSPVMEFLRPMGYTTLASDTGYEFFDFSNVDRLSSPAKRTGPYTLFEATLFKRSGLNVFIVRGGEYLPGDTEHTTASRSLGWVAKQVNDLVRHAFEAPFPETANGRYFLYQHILSPHPPFTLDREGRDWTRYANVFYEIVDGSHAIHGDPDARKAYVAGYTEKLIYTNAALLRRVEALISGTSGPLIIVVHGDHGGGAFFEHSDAATTCARERFSPLLAIYVSEPSWRAEIVTKLRRRPNLVNIYPAIFGTVFGFGAELHESRSEFMSWNDPFRPAPVTAKRLGEACPTP